MNITITRSELSSAIGVVHGVNASRTTLPILSNVLAVAYADRLTLTATDCDIVATASAACTIKKGGTGRTTIPLRRLAGIVKSMSGETIVLSVDDKHNATLQCGSFRAMLRGLPADEFPPEMKVAKPQSFTRPAEDFIGCIRAVIGCASTDDSRGALVGVHLAADSDNLNVIAADGRRLAVAKLKLKAKPFKATIPLKTAALLVQAFSEPGAMDADIDEDHARFTAGSVSVVTKLTSGSYPDLMPTLNGIESKTTATINREMLLNSVRAVSQVGDINAPSIKIVIAKGAIQLEAMAASVGEASEIVDAEINGPDITIALNPDYLGGILSAGTSENVEIGLQEPLSPIKITLGETIAALAPMRTT